jgi:hypothetical protein
MRGRRLRDAGRASLLVPLGAVRTSAVSATAASASPVAPTLSISGNKDSETH